MQIVIESSMNNFAVVHTCDPRTQRQEYFYESGNSWSYIGSGQLMRSCLSLRKKRKVLKVCIRQLIASRRRVSFL